MEREKRQYQQSLQSPTEPHSLTIALIHITIIVFSSYTLHTYQNT